MLLWLNFCIFYCNISMIELLKYSVWIISYLDLDVTIHIMYLIQSYKKEKKITLKNISNIF